MGRGPVPAARAARRHRGRPGHHPAGPAGAAALGRRADHARSGRCTPTASWPWPAPARRPACSMVVSSNAGTRVRRARRHRRAVVAAGLPACRPDPGRAAAATAPSRRGAEAVVLTVDTPVVGTKHAAGAVRSGTSSTRAVLRVNFDAGYDERPGCREGHRPRPARPRLAGASVTGLPVVVKGVLRADDARRCVAGRGRGRLGLQPRRPPAGPGRDDRLLPARRGRRRSSGEAEVYVDGGMRSGLDVLAALALGATRSSWAGCRCGRSSTARTGVARLHADLRAETDRGAPAGRAVAPSRTRGESRCHPPPP